MIYQANDKYSATLSSGFTVGQTTLYVSAVPDQVPTIIVAGKGTDNETVFTVTGKTTNSLTGVARLRGANVNLDATTPLTCLNNAEFINQYKDMPADGDAVSALIYAADGGSSDAYAVSLDPALTAYTAGLVVVFKANTANTGAATLNVNSLGAKTIKKNYNVDLADNDIKAGQIVTVVYDGTNFQLQTANPNAATLAGTETLTNKTLTDPKVNTLMDSNGNEELKTTVTANAVNEVTLNNAATAGTPGFTASGETNVNIQMIGKGTGLTKVSALRQDNATDTTEHHTVILHGWGFITGNGSDTRMTKAITFGITFAQYPIVLCTKLGNKDTSDPTDPSQFDLTTDDYQFMRAQSILTTGFTAEIKANAVLTNGRRHGFAWIAIGEL